MKQAATGTISGCLVWIIAFGVISVCTLSVSMPIGALTSTSDFAIRQTGAIVCPDNTTPEVRTTHYASGQRTTTSVLQCVDASGNVVKEDHVGYAFLWIGIVTVLGLILTGMLAFVFAAPAGILIAKLLNKFRSPKAK